MQTGRVSYVRIAAYLLAIAVLSPAQAQPSPAEFVPPKLHDIAGSPYKSRQIIQLNDSTLMIIGKPNDLRANDPDVGNIVLHRAGDTLYMVDSGALESYRPVILEAAKRLGPVKTVYLINTHNHTDHIANNDILWEIPAERRYLLMPRRTVEIVKSRQSHAEYYARGTGRIQQFAAVVPDLVKPQDSSTQYWMEALAPFTPMRPMQDRAIPLEQLPLRTLAIGGKRLTGWHITDDLYVLPTRGHTADSVVVIFPKAKLACLGDETNRLYHIFRDGDGVNSFQLVHTLLDIIDADAIDTLVDSHHFHVFNAGEARQWLSQMLEDEQYEQELLLRTLAEAGAQGLRLDEMIERLRRDPWWHRFYVPSSRTFPIVIPMVLLKRMEDMGVEELGQPPNSRFRLRDEVLKLGPQQRRADESSSDVPRTTVIKNVRLFDGERIVPNATVVLRAERIVQVAAAGEPLPPVEDPFSVVDGTGQTLLPGFLDAHFHTSGDIGSLRDSVRFGVTTVFDVYTPEQKLIELRRAIRYESSTDLSDFFSAGQCANVPGGHGTRDPAADTVSRPADAEPWIRRRIAAGVDYIKIVIEPGFFPGRDIPALDAETVRALVDAAHRHGLLTLAHVSRRASAEMAIDAGVDVLAHSWSGGLTDEIASSLLHKRIPVIPTIAVYDGLYGNAGTLAMVQDLRIRKYLPPQAIPTLTEVVDLPPHSRTSQELQALTGDLYRRGVKLLVGTDASNINVWPGASMHREMELMVQSGVTPIDVLRGATSAAADTYKKTDRGRVAAGKLADLVLVSGDPTVSIQDTRNITGIWKRGRLVKRELRQ